MFDMSVIERSTRQCHRFKYLSYGSVAFDLCTPWLYFEKKKIFMSALAALQQSVINERNRKVYSITLTRKMKKSVTRNC